MAANELSFNQVSTLLNEIQQMVTGATSEILTEGDFATVATTVLKTGYEQVYNAIGVVLGRTLFSIRPYTRKFKGLERTDGEFKLHTRKLQIADTDFEDNDTMTFPVHGQYNNIEGAESWQTGDGESVDQQVIKKSRILQTNFYGMNTYQNHYTIFDEQLDVAFSSSAELGRFFQMIIMNMENMFEQAREDFARMNLVNYITAIAAVANGSNGPRVIDLLSTYNDETGLSLNMVDLFAPDNYAPFMRWASARIKTYSDLMTERSGAFQNNIGGVMINRHTPKNRQRLFMLADSRNSIAANVLSTTFNDNYIDFPVTETIGFWQSIHDPYTVSFKPTFTGADGAVQVAPAVLTIPYVFAVLMDEDALGYSVVKTTVKPAPYNARGDYRNYFMKDYHKSYMDLSEKGIIFTLGEVIDEIGSA